MIKSLSYLFISIITISANCFALATTEIAPQAEVKKAILSPLAGSWLMIDAWDGLEKEEDEGIRIEFKGDKIIAYYDGEKEISSYKNDPEKKQITITTDGETVHGIYKIENDMLTMSYYLDSEDIAKTFEKAEDKVVISFKRMKPIDKKMLGRWVCAELWESGEKADDDEIKNLTYHLSNNLFEIFDAEELVDKNGHDVEPDESFLITINDKLKRMQLDDQLGDKYNAIYKFEESVLTIHFYNNTDEEGNNVDFPKDYEITDDSVFMKLKKSLVKEAKK